MALGLIAAHLLMQLVSAFWDPVVRCFGGLHSLPLRHWVWSVLLPFQLRFVTTVMQDFVAEITYAGRRLRTFFKEISLV